MYMLASNHMRRLWDGDVHRDEHAYTLLLMCSLARVAPDVRILGRNELKFTQMPLLTNHI